MDRTNTAIVRAMTYATVAVSDAEAVALCEDRLSFLIRPIDPSPPDHVLLPEQLTPDPKHSFVFWAPPVRPRSEDKPIPVYSPWGKVSVPAFIAPGAKEITPAQVFELRVQEPWWRNGKKARIRNYNGTHELRMDGEWSTEEGEDIAQWEAEGWTKAHPLLMPHAWSRFRLRLDRVQIARWEHVTWPMIEATGFRMFTVARTPKSQAVRSVFEQMWDLEYGQPSVIGPNKRGAHPINTNPFVWLLQVWPSHLPPPRVIRPPEQLPKPKVPGTFTATDHMRKHSNQMEASRDALNRGK